MSDEEKPIDTTPPSYLDEKPRGRRKPVDKGADSPVHDSSSE